jgi:REP element-mobilizing transposase RayT
LIILLKFIEAKPQVNALYIGMRKQRELKQGVWYKIRTRINNREPLFRYSAALELFAEVFGETRIRFVFKIRALCLVDDWLSFYIKPANGLELPDIMKWLKQVFAQRYNREEGRIGHIWGDRYWSLIVEDAEAEEAEPMGEQRGEGDARVRPRRGEAAMEVSPRLRRLIRVRPQGGKTTLQRLFSPISPPPAAPTPG